MKPDMRVRGRIVMAPYLPSPLLLTLPLIAFTVTAFVLPLALVLFRAIDNPELSAALPRSAALLRADSAVVGIPSLQVVRTLRAELAQSYGNEALGRLAKRLNSERPGARAALIGTARALAATPAATDALAELQAINEVWTDPSFWVLLRHAASPLTDHNLLAAFDLTRGSDGRIVPIEMDSAIYRAAAFRTLAISVAVTVACLVLGYPFAFLITNATGWALAILLGCLMLPFWTSLLVRSTAWVVLLQNEGLINKALLAAHIVDTPLALIRNRGGVVLAMTHVLLAFMVLPLIGVMRSIRPDLLQAAAASGARPLQAFRRVYWPLSMPGVAAGMLLVFIQAIGYFITPALVGGPNDQMLGFFIALHTNETLDWGMASALAALLLGAVLMLYMLWTKLAPLDGGLT